MKSAYGNRRTIGLELSRQGETVGKLQMTSYSVPDWGLSGEPVPRQRSLPERIRSDASVIPTLVAT